MGKCRHIFSRVEQQCTTTVIFLSNPPPQRTVSMRIIIISRIERERYMAPVFFCFFFYTYFKQESRRNVSHMCRQVMH